MWMVRFIKSESRATKAKENGSSNNSPKTSKKSSKRAQKRSKPVAPDAPDAPAAAAAVAESVGAPVEVRSENARFPKTQPKTQIASNETLSTWEFVKMARDALRTGGEKAAERVLNQPNVDIERRDEYGRTPLLHAAGCGLLDVVKFLHKHAKANAVCKAGATLLHYSGSGNLELAGWVLECMPDMINARTTVGELPLGMALGGGHTAIADLLLEKMGATAHAVDESGWTLAHSIAHGGHVKSLDWLLSKVKDIEIDAHHETGETPLHTAVRRNNFDMANKFVERGAKGRRNEKGLTLWQSVAESNKAEAFHWLCSKIAAGDLPPIDIEAADADGETPLQFAVRLGRTEVIPLLERAEEESRLARQTATLLNDRAAQAIAKAEAEKRLREIALADEQRQMEARREEEARAEQALADAMAKADAAARAIADAEAARELALAAQQRELQVQAHADDRKEQERAFDAKLKALEQKHKEQQAAFELKLKHLNEVQEQACKDVERLKEASAALLKQHADLETLKGKPATREVYENFKIHIENFVLTTKVAHAGGVQTSSDFLSHTNVQRLVKIGLLVSGAIKIVGKLAESALPGASAVAAALSAFVDVGTKLFQTISDKRQDEAISFIATLGNLDAYMAMAHDVAFGAVSSLSDVIEKAADADEMKAALKAKPESAWARVKESTGAKFDNLRERALGVLGGPPSFAEAVGDYLHVWLCFAVVDIQNGNWGQPPTSTAQLGAILMRGVLDTPAASSREGRLSGKPTGADPLGRNLAVGKSAPAAAVAATAAPAGLSQTLGTKAAAVAAPGSARQPAAAAPPAAPGVGKMQLPQAKTATTAAAPAPANNVRSPVERAENELLKKELAELAKRLERLEQAQFKGQQQPRDGT